MIATIIAVFNNKHAVEKFITANMMDKVFYPLETNDAVVDFVASTDVSDYYEEVHNSSYDGFLIGGIGGEMLVDLEILETYKNSLNYLNVNFIDIENEYAGALTLTDGVITETNYHFDLNNEQDMLILKAQDKYLFQYVND